MSEVMVNTRSVVRQNLKIQVRLTHWREMKVRLWLAVQILRLAALVGGLGLAIGYDNGPDESVA